MAILSKGTTYSDGDQVTSSNLNALVDSATFASGAVDDSTTQLSSGKIIVKDLGIATGKIATSAVTTVKILDSNVTTAKIADSNVTKAKIENVANLKVLGNVSGSAAAPAEVAILDEDNMASNSATSLATQQSIKTYADSKVDGTGAGSFTTLAASGDVTFDTTTLKVDSSNNRVGIGTATPEHSLSVFKDSAAARTEIGIDNTDQRLVLGSYFESGVAQYSTIQSTNNAETGAQSLALQPDGGNVGIGTATPSRLLTVAGDVEVNVVGSSNTSKGIVINSSGTNFESDAGIIQATHAGSGSLTGGYWLKFNANSADKFSVRGDGRTEISSTTGGVILPRMTTAQKNAISSPVNGEMVYDTNLNKFYGYANGAWVALH